MNHLSDHPLRHYFTTLDAGDFDACAACFAEDAVYLHPTDATTSGKAQPRLFVCKGRKGIREWLDKRGKKPHHHRIYFAATNGSSTFVEGRGGGGGVPLHAFASHAIFDETGLIKRYVAFMEYPDSEETVDSSVSLDNSEFKN